MKFKPTPTQLLFLCLFAGLLIRLILSPYFSYHLDINTYIYWANYLATNPANQFYANVWSDYLPGFHYVLKLVAIIQKSYLPNIDTIQTYQLYKLPAIFSDIINAFLIFKISQKFLSPQKALATTIIYLLNISLLANSTFWGQSDSFMSLFILASIYLLIQNKLTLSAIFIGFGQVVKPITLLTIPLSILYLFTNHSKKVSSPLIIYYLAIIFLTWLITFIPFANGPLTNFIPQRYATSFNQYSYSSLNAFNFWGLTVGFWVPDKNIVLGLSLQNWGNIFLLLNYLIITLAFIYALLHRSVVQKIYLLVFANALSYYGMFLFLTRIHERHNMAALVCLSVIILAGNKKSTLVITIAFTIYLLNLTYAYLQLSSNFTIFNYQTIQAFSLLNIFSYIYLLYYYLQQSFAKLEK